MTKNGLTWPFTLLGRKQEHAASRSATTNAAGETVQFSYHFNLLTDKHYPRLPQNDVHYDYDAYRHPIGIQDGSGSQQLFYDRMGRVSENIRTFAVPFSNYTYTFTMEYEYDSVDPMSDKYPSISPYAYCAWNPVKLVDPDGNFLIPTHAIMVFKSCIRIGLRCLWKIGLTNMIKMCYGTSIQADLFHWKRSEVHLDGYNTYGPNNPSELISSYNNAIANYQKNFSNEDYYNAGEALHTIADFYSHSNYIDLYAQYAELNNLSKDIKDIPTFSEAQKDADLMRFLDGKLKTGIYPDDDNNKENSHKGMTKDSIKKGIGGNQYLETEHTFYDAARETAQKETNEIVNDNI